MQLVERHFFKEGSKEYRIFDELCFKTKNLYNATLYKIRQEYTNSKDKIYLNYPTVQRIFQEDKQFDYIQLPAKVSQQTMRLVDQNFKSFFASLKDYNKNSGKYKGRPKLPKYLDSKRGRQVAIYTNQAISKIWLKKDYIVLSKLNGIKIKLRKNHIKVVNQVRIVPGIGRYVVEVVYTVPDPVKKSDNSRYAAIDLGVNNLMTLTTNIDKHIPFVISGKKVKSINHYYNKKKAHYTSLIPKSTPYKTTKRLRRLEYKRYTKINDYFHKASRYIVTYLVSENINTLIIGNNKGWKQNTNIGNVNNQNFVQIPFYRLIQMLSYKCKMSGINIEIITEEYTSKCSFLDNEVIGKHDKYLGKRITRGLFISSSGKSINADVNGSYNILSKCKPGAFANGVQGVVVHPHVLCVA